MVLFYFILFYYVRVKIPKTKITARNRIDSSYEKSIEAARHFYLVGNRLIQCYKIEIRKLFLYVIRRRRFRSSIVIMRTGGFTFDKRNFFHNFL